MLISSCVSSYMVKQPIFEFNTEKSYFGDHNQDKLWANTEFTESSVFHYSSVHHFTFSFTVYHGFFKEFHFSAITFGYFLYCQKFIVWRIFILNFLVSSMNVSEPESAESSGILLNFIISGTVKSNYISHACRRSIPSPACFCRHNT